jgi:predicted enzyme related to lactoylglutathione lyase
VAAIWYVTIDCADPEVAAGFWSALLDLPRHGPYTAVGPICPGGPSLAFQQVPDAAKVAKSRVHLDIAVDDLAAATRRAVALGATVLATRTEGGQTWTTLADPDGNEFCLDAGMHPPPAR